MQLTPMQLERLGATRFADVRYVNVTGSTNTDVLDMGRSGEPEGTVVVADRQTAGRGRRGRAWEAQEGDALLTSILLRPPATVAPLATAVLAVAATDAVAEVGGDLGTVGIKWPNDIVVTSAAGDRKLAGILAEADWSANANASAGWRAPTPGERALVSAGIGVNLHWPVPGSVSQDADLEARAISLDEVLRERVEREEVFVALLVALERRYSELLREGAASILEPWRERCVTLGRRVRVDLGADDLEGRAVAIDDSGHLVVETLAGDRRVLAVGDVVHLR